MVYMLMARASQNSDEDQCCSLKLGKLYCSYLNVLRFVFGFIGFEPPIPTA